MVFKTSNWYTRAKDIKDNTYTENDVISAGTMMESPSNISINRALFPAEARETRSWSPESVKTEIYPNVFKNQLYNTVWAPNKTFGWHHRGECGDNGSINSDWGLGLGFHATMGHSWSIWTYGRQDFPRLRNEYSRLGTATVAMRIGVRMVGDAGALGNDGRYSNYGFGSIQFRLTKGTDGNLNRYVTNANGKHAWLPWACDSTWGDLGAFHYGDYGINSSKQLSGVFYIPWVVFKPTEAWDTFVINSDSIGNQKSGGTVYFFDPQLIVVPDGTTQQQLMNADIHVIPNYQDYTEETHPNNQPGPYL